jgi:hypothetical protein
MLAATCSTHLATAGPAALLLHLPQAPPGWPERARCVRQQSPGPEPPRSSAATAALKAHPHLQVPALAAAAAAAAAAPAHGLWDAHRPIALDGLLWRATMRRHTGCLQPGTATHESTAASPPASCWPAAPRCRSSQLQPWAQAPAAWRWHRCMEVSRKNKVCFHQAGWVTQGHLMG